MHTYREAIQGVTGSFILYSGTQDILFPRHHAGSRLIDGVGALALRPGSDAGQSVSGASNIKRIIETFLRSA
ncbi:MAG: hypothetical protein JZU65_11710, partial [Chlorobium sp.]|nr:hypothetical protein [Chlorobium sp.]